jgi:arsenite-transporting ATPase
LKVTTANSSSTASTRSKPARLTVFTGKGGVGKTSVALAYALALKDEGYRVLYNSFDQLPNTSLVQNLDIPCLSLSLEESAKEYMGRKLGSTMVAHWIMKTPFFSSLLNMLPGLGQMILFGHLLAQIQDDPTLHIVLDSPSSGHAMTMFESSHNFKEIFRTGPLVQDIERMHAFMSDTNNLKTVIITTPSPMAVSEGLELQGQFLELGLKHVSLLLNDSLMKCSAIQNSNPEELPPFIKKKIQLEIDSTSRLGSELSVILPHSASDGQEEIIRYLSPLMASVSL